MLLQFFNKRSKHGFTLVELLIVVAIIGVLSTIGVPTFRRMIQKSKKAEAKVNLGGLYTAEVAFFSEYNGYGNNLDKVGYTTDGPYPQAGSLNNAIYMIGFYGSGCAPTSGLSGQTTAKPSSSGQAALYTAINTAFPSYYTAGLNTAFGALVLTGGCLPSTFPPSPGTGATFSTFDVNESGMTNGVAHYMAGASGVIAPGMSINGGSNALVDIWSIDDARNLVNATDGVQ